MKSVLWSIALVAAAAVAAPRAAAVSVSVTPQVSINYTGNTLNSVTNHDLIPPFIPMTDARLIKTAPGCAPEQVRLTYWSSARAKTVRFLVSWATCDAVYNSAATALAVPKAKPEVWLSEGGAAGPFRKRAKGHSTSYLMDWTATGGAKYASPLLHHVLVKGLEPGRTYWYKIQDLTGGGGAGRRLQQAAAAAAAAGDETSTQAKPPADWGPNPFEGSFTVPAARFPLKVGIWGDPGQLENVTEIMSALQASDAQMFWILGDIAYGDNFQNENFLDLPGACSGPEKACDLAAACAPGDPSFFPPYQFPCLTTTSYGPRWDTFGRLAQPLLSARPQMHTNGNHEIEPFPKGASMWDFEQRSINYNARWPVPQTNRERGSGPRTFGPVTQKKKAANMYSAAEVAGVVKTIQLTSYIPQDDFSTKSEQYKFLKRELKSTNRKRTPWLVVIMHAPWYTSITKHFKEAECMRQTYEPLFIKYGVDIVVTGHNHAYERVLPVNDYTTGGQCSPMHVTMGNGAADDLTVGFIDIDRTIQPADSAKGPYFYCVGDGVDGAKFNSSLAIYQKAICPMWDITPPGPWCPFAQPEWSAYRESVFGWVDLTFDSATQATWKFVRAGEPTAADEVVITRHPSACGIKA